jgi:PAS domain S-box-containing protein
LSPPRIGWPRWPARRLLDSAPEEAFDRVTRLAARVLQVPVVLVSLVDRDRQFFKSQVGLPEPWASACQTPLSHSFCQHVVVRHSPLVIPDARLDPLVRENQAVTDLGVVAYAGVPLATREGHVLGALCAIDGEPRAWTDEDVVVLRDLAALVVTEIELRRSAGAAERRAEEMAALLESTAEGIYGIDLEGNCTFVNRTAARLLGHAPGEMIGQNIHELIHHTRPDGTPYPQAECPIVRASTLGRGCRVDDEVLWRRDGTSFCVEYASSPIRQGQRRRDHGNRGCLFGYYPAQTDRGRTGARS